MITNGNVTGNLRSALQLPLIQFGIKIAATIIAVRGRRFPASV